MLIDLRAGGNLWLGSTSKACSSWCRGSPRANKGSDKGAPPASETIDEGSGQPSSEGAGGRVPRAVRRSRVRRTARRWLAGTLTAAGEGPCRRARRWGCRGRDRGDENGIAGRREESGAEAVAPAPAAWVVMVLWAAAAEEVKEALAAA